MTMMDSSDEKHTNQNKTDCKLICSLNLKDDKSNYRNTNLSTISGINSVLSGSSNNSKLNQYQFSQHSPSFSKTQFSTPKSFPQKIKKNANQTGISNECEFSITNPFENQSTIDSLLQPSLSPSIFESAANNTVNKSVCNSPGSFWNIDQIALMKPVDIDLSKLHEQQNFVKLDPAMEIKAQQAIDSFFANGINLTSPWSSAERPHYLAIISPAVPPSSQKRHNRDYAATPSAFNNDFPLIEKEIHDDNKVSVATQTLLSIPFDVDLSKILAKYFPTESNTGNKAIADVQSNDVLSNSSLRRKLFFHDADDRNHDTDDSCFDESALKDVRIAKKTVGEEPDAFPMYSNNSFMNRIKTPFSTESDKTPVLKNKPPNPVTPSSFQSPFSSSPVTGGRMFDLGTPYRALDHVKFDCFSPGSEYSPIRSANHGLTTSNHRPK